MSNERSWSRNFLLGFLAALTVPLLLSIVQSNLLQDALSNDASAAPDGVVKILVFGGYCVLAGLFADRFLSGLGENVLLKKIEEAQAAADAATAKAEDAQSTAEAAHETAVGAQETVIDASLPEGDAASDGAATDFQTEEATDEASGEGAEKENFSLNPEGKTAKKPRTAKAPPTSEAKVWASLTGKGFKMRTAIGIAKEADMSVDSVEKELLAMEAKGRAKSISRRDGSKVWMPVR